MEKMNESIQQEQRTKNEAQGSKFKALISAVSLRSRPERALQRLSCSPRGLQFQASQASTNQYSEVRTTCLQHTEIERQDLVAGMLSVNPSRSSSRPTQIIGLVHQPHHGKKIRHSRAQYRKRQASQQREDRGRQSKNFMLIEGIRKLCDR